MTARRPSRAADRRPTWTSLVVRALAERDDFANFEQLRAATGASPKQLSATLFHLKNVHAVDALECEGHLWWFLTGADDRTRPLDERVPELPGNRTRGGKRR